MAAITQEGPLDHAELVERLRGMKTKERVGEIVSGAAVRGILRGLTGDGDLPEGRRDGKAGNRHYVEISRAAGCVVGLNVGRTYFAIGVADPNGRLLSTDGDPPDHGLKGKKEEAAWERYREGQLVEHQRESGVDGMALLKHTAEKTIARVKELGVAPEEIRGITLSLPAPVSTTESRLLTHSIEPNLANIKNIERAFKAKLGKKEGKGLYPNLEKVVVANDADVAAQGEVRYGGHGYQRKDVIAIHAAYGIGAGIIADGNVLRTAAGGGPGEIGHCVPTIARDEGVQHGLAKLDPTDELFTCVCEHPNHLEAMAGGEAIVRRVSEPVAKLSSRPPRRLAKVLKDPKKTVAAKLDELLKAISGEAPWEPGLEAVLDAAHMIGGSIHTIAHLLRPEVVYLCGKLSEAGTPFRDMVREGFEELGSLADYEPMIELGEATDEFRRRLIMVRGAAMTAVRETVPLNLGELGLTPEEFRKLGRVQ
jgi:predicted NBD/HSP70 family sugar kinase